MNQTDTNWYVVYTRPRWEKKVSQMLEEKGIVHYCPLNKVEKKWSDRMKVVHEPLFKGYVFVQVADSRKWDLKLLPGIINYIYWLGKPARVQQFEIDTIKKFLQEFENVEVYNPNLEEQDVVLVQQGILMNYKGLVLDVSGSQVRVKISSMGVQLTATFKKENLALLEKAKPSA